MVKDTEKDLEKEDQEGGEGGEGGKGKSGGSGFIPTYNDLFAVTADEAEIARCAKEGVFAQRVSLKSQGEEVTALDKLNELRKRLSDPRVAADLAGGGGADFEQHPELADLGGVFDDIVFPESEAEAAARNDPALRNELRARLGMGLSFETLREEYKNKAKMAMRGPAPDTPRPSFRPAAPPPRPRPF